MFQLLFIIFLFTGTNAARILCYFPDPSISHVLLALPIAEELARRGHDLTVITNRNFLPDTPNYKEIVIPTRGFHGEILEMFSTGKIGKSPKFLFEAIQQFTDNNIDTIKSNTFQTMLTEDSFDLVFFQSVFFNNFQLGIADHFKAPWITISPMGNTYATSDLLGTISHASTVPTRFATYSPYMSFPLRLVNFIGVVFENLLCAYMDRQEETLYNELWPTARSFTEMKRNGSLVLLNGHWSESTKIRPTLPNEVEIGGIQIRKHPKPLELDVQKFLDDAKDGVIVWTFGSTLPIDVVDSEKLNIMFSVLGERKEKVILRWDSEDVSKLPANFMGRKWLAQDSILAHKNVKLFITHGGLGGVMEAAHHGVPIFGIPFFADQNANVAKAVSEGWALGMQIFDLTEVNFSAAISDLLYSQRYRNKASELGQKYRDRLNGPLESAVFWIEYVLKYHGAPHVTYSGRNLNFFQMYSLDVITAILIVLYVLYRVFKAALKFSFRKLFSSKIKSKTM